ncbi:MAG TPA: AgmX/PglI C-terminal domain-containing protein [Polyangia bacterium]|nr:AgmX/PglI C-terminal domain-containing protein [Polyangia bacterium]
MAGPTLFETGRVAAARVTDPGVAIQRRREFASPNEAAVQVTPGGEEQSSPIVPRPVSTSDPVAMEREVRAHLAALADCRVESARRDQIRPDQVIASELVLRWTILRTGVVSDTAVVATQPIDSNVMGCVKERMNSWTFSPIAGASAEVERKLVFR